MKDIYINTIKNRYFDFEGRTGRREYWMFFLANLIVYFIIWILEKMIFNMDMDLFSMLYSLAVLLPSLGIFVRRLHDIGKSGFWIFIGLIPFVGFVVLLYFLVKKGDIGENLYDKKLNPVV